MGFTPELYSRCRNVLLECSEFDNDNALRSVFVTNQLEIYHDRLPQCSSKEDRVSRTMEYLLRQRSRDNEPVLSLFLAALSSRRHLNDYTRQVLDMLYAETIQILDDEAVASVVVAAMTKYEAENLFSEAVFNTPEVAPADGSRFRDFKKTLEHCDFTDLVNRYSDRRENWRPWTASATPICGLVQGALDYVNMHHREPAGLPKISLSNLSNEFFVEDQERRTQTIRQLAQIGGILIIDAVSLFHPTIVRRVSSAGIGANKRVAILVISPIDSSSLPANRLVDETMQRQLLSAFMRYNDFDSLCEIENGNPLGAKRWLATALNAAVDELTSPSPLRRQQLRRLINEEPRHIERAFFSQGGRL